MDDTEIDLDSVIDRLLEVRGSRPGKQVQLLEKEIRYLCTKAREIFISQPILLELEAPIKVCKSSCSPSSGYCSMLARSFADKLFCKSRFAVIFMANITTCCDCSSMVDFLLRQTTCSSVTMSIEASSLWKLSAFFLPTK
jgi:hypothetical protein